LPAASTQDGDGDEDSKSLINQISTRNYDRIAASTAVPGKRNKLNAILSSDKESVRSMIKSEVAVVQDEPHHSSKVSAIEVGCKSVTN
jgi:hypothetical protein